MSTFNLFKEAARIDRKRPNIENWPRCIGGDYSTLLAVAQKLQEQGCSFHYTGPGILNQTAHLWVGSIPKDKRAVCGARTRRGTDCKARCTASGSRCRLHGGLSTGPKTEAGRQAIRESNRRRAEARRAEKRC